MGYEGVPIFVLYPPFHLVRGVVVDYLHCVLLGVVKNADGVLVQNIQLWEAILHWQEGIQHQLSVPIMTVEFVIPSWFDRICSPYAMIDF